MAEGRIYRKGAFNTTRARTPQGGIISPVLANMYLDRLERKLNEQAAIKKTTVEGRKNRPCK
ncbi:hypothetical protein BB987_16795 [Photorhabdus temperata]|nr:hypothetical protein BB987_16795 [Photorhabdus temperata]